MYSPICTFIPIWRAPMAEKQTIPIRGRGVFCGTGTQGGR